MKKKVHLASVIILLHCSAAVSAEYEYFVSVEGSDLWDGTSESHVEGTDVGPWQSLKHAVEEIRKVRPIPPTSGVQFNWILKTLLNILLRFLLSFTGWPTVLQNSIEQSMEFSISNWIEPLYCGHEWGVTLRSICFEYTRLYYRGGGDCARFTWAPCSASWGAPV